MVARLIIGLMLTEGGVDLGSAGTAWFSNISRLSLRCFIAALVSAINEVKVTSIPFSVWQKTW